MVVRSISNSFVEVGRGLFNTEIPQTHSRDLFGLGFEIWNLSLESNQASIVKQGYGLKKVIDEVKQLNNASKVILFGHSMGGLAIREYLQSDYYQDDVAKVVTIGTPHGGSNGWVELANLNGTDIDEKSDAVRDLRYSYPNNPINPLDNVPGTYLFSGNESDIPDNSYYYDKDVNCNGDLGNYIIGLSECDEDLSYLKPSAQKRLPNNIKYTWITSDYLIGGGDKVVDLKRQWLYGTDNNNIKRPYPFGIADTLLTHLFHTDETSDKWSIVRGLDEPGDYNLAYQIELDVRYSGTITYNMNRLANDVDIYRFEVPTTGELNVTFGGTNSALDSVAVMNSNHQRITSVTFNEIIPITINLQNSGSYYLAFYGTATDVSWHNPYWYKIQLTTNVLTADFDVDVTSGPAPLSVNFHDKSSGNITSWEWDFNNDGVIDSYDQNPEHTYTVSGVYSVRLTVSDGLNSNSAFKENLITVTQEVENTKLAFAEYFFDDDP
jgi:hypothetical protein